jgi:RNA polymerase sigma-70 factor (ECF subfamily)
MNKKEERKLLEGARNYDRVILAQIYDCYSPGLFKYAMRLLGEAQLSEDCVSDTFSRLLKALRQKSGPRDHLQAYLYRIAHNWITDYYRKPQRITEDLDEAITADPHEQPQEMTDKRMTSQQVRNAILALAPEQRQVITLRYLQEWDFADIADTLEKSIGAVKALKHRGLERLNEILASMER